MLIINRATPRGNLFVTTQIAMFQKGKEKGKAETQGEGERRPKHWGWLAGGAMAVAWSRAVSSIGFPVPA